jgi:hypothetical protein
MLDYSVSTRSPMGPDVGELEASPCDVSTRTRSRPTKAAFDRRPCQHRPHTGPVPPGHQDTRTPGHQDTRTPGLPGPPGSPGTTGIAGDQGRPQGSAPGLAVRSGGRRLRRAQRARPARYVRTPGTLASGTGPKGCVLVEQRGRVCARSSVGGRRRTTVRVHRVGARGARRFWYPRSSRRHGREPMASNRSAAERPSIRKCKSPEHSGG